MAWFRVDDGFWSHPKVIGLSADAIALWTLAGSWAGQQGTGGAVPTAMLPLLRGKPKAAAELVKAGLWRTDGDGWQFHDWQDYNFDAESVQDRKRRQSEASALANHERWHVRAGKVSDSCALCADSDTASDSESDSDRSPDSDRTPPIPSPSLPETDRTTTTSSPTEVTAREMQDEVEEQAAKFGVKDLARLRSAVMAHLHPADDPSDAELLDILAELDQVATGHVKSWYAYIEGSRSSDGIREAWGRVLAARPPAVIQIGGAA